MCADGVGAGAGGQVWGGGAGLGRGTGLGRWGAHCLTLQSKEGIGGLSALETRGRRLSSGMLPDASTRGTKPS